ncbi:hypothetical protein ACSNOI_42020, partial [Actinomadura kijaniata]|uniref:hypothetical protein n=1 Tax=Actinomadura kijaniata TaxID=46161 RepID=UPI003F1B6B56
MSAHSTAKPSRAAKAGAAWAALTARQQEALRLVYEADQQAEQDAAAHWHEAMHAVPARVWRWLHYGWTGGRGPRPRLGKDLDRGRRRGSALDEEVAALQSAGLVQLRYLNSEPPWNTDPAADTVLAARPADRSCFVQVQITRAGRAAYRAACGDQHRDIRRQGLLSEGLWSMLAQVHAADHGGRVPGAVSPAWRHLTDRQPSLVQGEGIGSARLRLTPDGHAHYAQHWATYLRVYPDVNAPRPDGQPLWPTTATATLMQLRRGCLRLRELLAALGAQRTDLAAPPPVPALAADATDLLPEAVPGELAEPTAVLLERHHTAVADYLAAHQQAVTAYVRAHDPALRALRRALADQIDQAGDLYRRACVRYVLAATAAVTTTVAVHHAHQPHPREASPVVPDLRALEDALDPALTIESDTVERAVVAWPWRPPAPPATGLPDTDAQLRTDHQHTTAPPAPPSVQARRSRRSARTHPALEPSRSGEALEPEADRLTRYADALAELVQRGLLTRLLLRDRTAQRHSAMSGGRPGIGPSGIVDDRAGVAAGVGGGGCGGFGHRLRVVVRWDGPV